MKSNEIIILLTLFHHKLHVVRPLDKLKPCGYSKFNVLLFIKCFDGWAMVVHTFTLSTQETEEGGYL